MAHRSDPQREINFLNEGILVLCDEAGLEIQVTDYHAMPLKLSWVTLHGWRIEATSARAAPPPEVPPSLPPRQVIAVPVAPAASERRRSRRKRRR